MIVKVTDINVTFLLSTPHYITTETYGVKFTSTYLS